MTEPIYLLLGIHHHQPVGNFGSVFKDAFEKCYRPFLEIMERHPSIKFSLHHSGPLLDWAQEHEGNYLDRVLRLAERGQMEILGGGFYEPILPILTIKDALGQIEMMQSFWQKLAGRKPRGMWLAERVWEPSLAALLNDAGIEFTILDDEHFRHAGLTDEVLFGHYLTERAGKSLSIFPTDKTMRYFVPFREPHDVIGHLKHLRNRFPGKSITYGDDGEKFGVWPGTYDWVIVKGWLERFLTELENNSDTIETITFSEHMAANEPEGRVYLPTASYSEMLEWAMPAGAILEYEDTKHAIENAGLWYRTERFFRGGFWDNFLTKYPESNLTHKRSIYVSNRIEKASKNNRDLTEARHSLYKAQCNCAYWHGLFGGLYLNYLRHALHENLIDAEAKVDKKIYGENPFLRTEALDLDLDGFEEVVMADEFLNCIVKPATGGGLAALDIRPKRFNLLNTLARRFEAYHKHKNGEGNKDGENVSSIHALNKDLGDLAKLLIYDKTPRYAFLDHAFEEEPDWESLKNGALNSTSGLDTAHYKIVKHGTDEQCAYLEMSGNNTPASQLRLLVDKKYTLKHNGDLLVTYAWRAESKKCPKWLATEINFTLLAGHDKDRFYLWEGTEPATIFMDARMVLNRIDSIEAVDRAFGFKMKINAKADRVILFPIETVSQSEKGFDRIYQGSDILLAWKPDWSASGTSQFSIGITVETI